MLPGPAQALADRIAIRDHVTFGGRFDPETAGVVEHLITLSGAAGDFRGPDRIRRWALVVGTQLKAAVVAHGA